MSISRRLRRALKLDAPAAPYPGQWVDRHSLARLLASANVALERAGRCECGAGGRIGTVRCLEDAEPGRRICRACRDFCDTRPVTYAKA